MDRRTLLKGAGATTLMLGASGLVRARPQTSQSVLIIGAGIIGAGIAYELAKRGAQVTVVERKAPASATTGDSYAYLNASTKSGSQPYFALNWMGMAGWRVWQQEAGPAFPLRWDGSVYWRDSADEAGKLDRALAAVKGWGYSAEHLDAGDVRRLMPTVQSGPVQTAAYFPEEGSVDPVAAVDVLLARAKQLGAKVLYPVEVSSLIVTNGQVRGVRTNHGEMLADTVVLAAGLGSKALAEAQGVKLPLSGSAGILLHTHPHAQIIGRMAAAPHATFRQMSDGRILASIGHEGASVVGNATPERIAKDILDATAAYLPQIRDVKIDRVSIGQRVLPADSFPIAGYAPNMKGLYMVTTHSGMTLAPILGRAAAIEILDGISVAPLAMFRPQRFG